MRLLQKECGKCLRHPFLWIVCITFGLFQFLSIYTYVGNAGMRKELRQMHVAVTDECVMEDRAFDAFQDTHLILSVRQEQEHMQVRYYSSKPEEGSRNCTPNLEDVFLVTYQEEPA